MSPNFLAFVHMERAGGTTLHHLLRAALPGYLTVHPWYYWANDPEHALGPTELGALVKAAPWTRGVGGHTVRAWFDYESAVGRPVSYLTFLREPVARTFSHWRYQRARMGSKRSLEEFCAEPRFANYQTVRLVGRPDADVAYRLLVERFAMVGLTERYDESVLAMCAALGIGRPLAPAAGENGVESGAVLGERERALLQSVNVEDLRLYYRVRDELFPALISRYREAAPGTGATRWRLRGLLGKVAEAPTRVLIEPLVHRRFGVLQATERAAATVAESDV